MSEHAKAPGNGGLEFDEVVIEGVTYRVRQEVVDEIINLRRGVTHEIVNAIVLLEPKPRDTIVVTVPEKVGPEFVSQVGQVTKQQFPEHQIAVIPEHMKLHTAKGLAQMADLGLKLATAVQEDNPAAAKPIADSLVKLLNDGLKEDEDAGA